MKLKDKCTIYIKNQKPLSLLQILNITIAIILVLMVMYCFTQKMKKAYYEYTPVMKDASYRATFVGDITFGRSITEIGKRNGYNSLFKNVSNIWQNSNTVVCNFENAIIDDVKNYSVKDKTNSLYASYNSVNSLKGSGFNLISLANNQVSNYGSKGVKNTINVLKENGLEYIGAGENIEEASKYSIKEVNGLKIAIISISDKIQNNATATTDNAGIFTTSYFEYPLIISKAKTEADIVIVYTHWGETNTQIITESQEELARNFINSGADLVIGGHQHTVQPVEKYNNGIILHGIGNFVFDQGWDFAKESVLVNFSVNQNGNYAIEILPIYLEGATPEVATDFYHKNRIFTILTKRLNKEDYTIEENKLILEGKFEIKI